MEQNASIPKNSFSELALFSVSDDLKAAYATAYIGIADKIYNLFMRSKRTTANQDMAYSDYDFLSRTINEAADSGAITETDRKGIMDIINRYRRLIYSETRY